MASPFRVYVDGKALAAFRRRVLRYYRKHKTEYMEVLFIHRAVSEFHVREFRQIKILSSTYDMVAYCPEDWSALTKEARSLGLEVGSIHTHPSSYGTQPSKEDYTSGEGDVLIGICEIYDPNYPSCITCGPVQSKTASKRFSTKLDFWIPVRPCVLKIIPT